MPRFACLAAALLIAPPALAQPLRSIVVPADAAIAIPPRGQPWPAPAPATGIVQSLPVMPTAPTVTVPLAAAPMALGAVVPIIIPLAAAALLGGSLAGGGSGGSAPVATR
jgi:hypothetical protein